MTPVKDVELEQAIGAVVISSAWLEYSLRDSLGELAGMNDANWWLFEGQPMDWMLDTLRRVTFELDPYGNRWSESQWGRFTEIVQHASWLNDQRNVVVHSRWSSTAYYRKNNEESRGRPWGDTDDVEALWYARRSRRTARADKNFSEHTFAVSDVRRLAEELGTTADEIRNLLTELGNAHDGG